MLHSLKIARVIRPIINSLREHLSVVIKKLQQIQTQGQTTPQNTQKKTTKDQRATFQMLKLQHVKSKKFSYTRRP